MALLFFCLGFIACSPSDEGKGSDTDLGFKPHGIVNTGNSCYANSVAQLLMLMEDPFWEAGRSKYLNGSTITSKEKDFLQTVFDFRQSWQTNAVTPKILSEKLRAVINTGVDNKIYEFKGKCNQEDATEFLTGIMQFLGNTSYPSFYGKSIITFDVGAGIQKNETDEGLKYYIPCPISGLSEGATFTDALRQGYFLKEDMKSPNQYEYDDVNHLKTDAVKFSRLSQDSDYLFVSFNRFEVIGIKSDGSLEKQKINTALDFGNGEINLREFIDPTPAQDQIFEIVGMSLHSGSTDGGHYTARVKYDGGWFVADDSSVARSSWKKVKEDAARQAYLLLLRKKK